MLLIRLLGFVWTCWSDCNLSKLEYLSFDDYTKPLAYLQFYVPTNHEYPILFLPQKGKPTYLGSFYPTSIVLAAMDANTKHSIDIALVYFEKENNKEVLAGPLISFHFNWNCRIKLHAYDSNLTFFENNPSFLLQCRHNENDELVVYTILKRIGQVNDLTAEAVYKDNSCCTIVANKTSTWQKDSILLMPTENKQNNLKMRQQKLEDQMHEDALFCNNSERALCLIGLLFILFLHMFKF